MFAEQASSSGVLGGTHGPIAGNLCMVGNVSQFTLILQPSYGQHKPHISYDGGPEPRVFRVNEINCTYKSRFTSTESAVLAQSLRVYDEYRK